MKGFLVKFIIGILLLLLHEFFLSLAPPINTIQVITIGIMLLFLFTDFSTALMAALGFGFILDYIHIGVVGVTSGAYALALFFVLILRNRSITHENHLSALLLSTLFSVGYFTLQMLTTFHFTVPAFQELLFSLLLNTLLMFVVYMIIAVTLRQIHKQFL